MFKTPRNQPKRFIIETKHGPIDVIDFINRDLGKISTGLWEGFIVPTNLIMSFREMWQNESNIESL